MGYSNARLLGDGKRNHQVGSFVFFTSNKFHEVYNFFFRLSLLNLIGADIAAASVLISMGALLGRISPIQLLVMGLIEITIFASNEFLQIELMKVKFIEALEETLIKLITHA